MKKFLATVLSLCMILTMLPVAAMAVNYKDTDGHWGEEAIDRWSDAGVVEGYEDNSFLPDNYMRRCEVATALANLMQLSEKADLSKYTDVPADAWYADAIAMCVAAGIMDGDSATTMNPNGYITREQMFKMFANAMGIDGQSEINKTFSDFGSVSSWAKPYVCALVNLGFVDGVSADRLAPQKLLTRAMLMKLMDNTIAAYVTEDGKVTPKGDGIILVVSNDVQISGDFEGVIVVANEDAKVDLKGLKGKVEVIAVADNVAVNNAPAGTKVTSANDNVTGVTANGEDVAKNTTVIVKEEESASGGSSTPSHSHSYETVTEATCTTDGLEKCSCGREKAIPALGHDIVDGVCTRGCDIVEKFKLTVESGAKVEGVVYDDYSAKLLVEAGEVDAGSVTLTATMTDVGSLGVEGTRTHTTTINTGIDKDGIDLTSHLENAFFFEGATVNATIGDKETTYVLKGENALDSEFEGEITEDAVITATPEDVQATREAWAELTSHVAYGTGEEDNSFIVIANGAYLQGNKELLSFAEDYTWDLVLDNFSDLGAMEEEIRRAVVLTNNEANEIVAYLPAGTALAVGSSIASLSDHCTITITGASLPEGTLESLQGQSGAANLVKALVGLVNDAIAAANGKTINVDIQFECDHIVSNCAAGGKCMKPGCDETIDPTTHTFVDGICVVCRAEAGDVAKFGLSVESNDEGVFAVVYDDYTAALIITPGDVSASEVTLTAAMQNVGSLGVEGMRTHTTTITTGMSADADLSYWLANAFAFTNATINVDVDGTAATYILAGVDPQIEGDIEHDAMITATPEDVADMRAVWMALTDNVTPETKDNEDSYIVVGNGSFLQVGGEKLQFAEVPGDHLTLDNFGDLAALEQTIRDAVELVSAEDDTIVARVAAGTALAVGGSVATLDKDCTITIDLNGDYSELIDGVLGDLQETSRTEDIVKALVKLVNNVIGAAEGAEIDVAISFAE